MVRNRIEGNQWKGTSFFAASAVLVFAADPGGVEVARNVIDGNSDVGIFVVSDGDVFDNNKVFDTGADHPNSCCDIGIGNFGEDNPVTNNKVRGFEIPLAGPDDGDNKVIPSPNLDHGG